MDESEYIEGPDDASTQEQRRSSWGMALAVAFMVGYPLSIGPAVWVSNRAPSGAVVYIWMPYTPLIILADNVPVVKKMAESYALFWNEL